MSLAAVGYGLKVGVFVILVILYFRRVPVSTGYTHFKADDFEVMAA